MSEPKWNEDARMVLERLDRIEQKLDSLEQAFQEHRRSTEVTIAVLMVRAGVFGALAGMIPVAVAIGIAVLSHWTGGTK